jgi:flagellar basal body-associated protein FliL
MATKDGEDIPLKSTTSPETIETSRGFWSRNVICSNLKILLFILLVVFLVVLVIVLAVLLGYAKSKSGKRAFVSCLV